jgi:hypothetical protein
MMLLNAVVEVLAVPVADVAPSWLRSARGAVVTWAGVMSVTVWQIERTSLYGDASIARAPLTIAWSRRVLHNFAPIPRRAHSATADAGMTETTLPSSLPSRCIATTAPPAKNSACGWKEHTMADDRTITDQANRLRINMNEDYEVRYWTQKWNISREDLAAAVREAGVMVKDVARKLGKEG